MHHNDEISKMLFRIVLDRVHHIRTSCFSWNKEDMVIHVIQQGATLDYSHGGELHIGRMSQMEN